MRWTTDVVLLLAVAKLVWELAAERLISVALAVSSAALLAFLLGLAGPFAEGVFRHALALAVLIIFIWGTLQQPGRAAFVGFAAVLVCLYVLANVASRLRWFLVATVAVLFAVYFASFR